MSEAVSHVRRQIHYHGRVQGVGFRYQTQRIASSFDVRGYVQNLPDGSVRVVIEGGLAEVDRFLAAVNRELARYIAGAESLELPFTGEFQQFSIRY